MIRSPDDKANFCQAYEGRRGQVFLPNANLKPPADAMTDETIADLEQAVKEHKVGKTIRLEDV